MSARLRNHSDTSAVRSREGRSWGMGTPRADDSNDGNSVVGKKKARRQAVLVRPVVRPRPPQWRLADDGPTPARREARPAPRIVGYRSSLPREHISAADFMRGQRFQRPQQAGMVPVATPLCDAGLEQLLGVSGTGQRQVEAACTLKRQVEILLMQANPETRIKGALDHAFADRKIVV